MEPFYIAIVLYVAAVVLAILDIFIPSGGMFLILAAAAALASILFGFRSGTTMGMVMLTIIAASIPLFAFAAIRIWPRTPIGRRVILGTPDRKSDSSGSPRTVLESLVGRVVLTEQTFMPTGQLRIDSHRINAISTEGIIEAGSHVEVIGVRGRDLLIRPTNRPLTHPSAVSPSSSLTPQATTPGDTATSDARADSAIPPTDSPNLLDMPASELDLDSLDE